jgi:hypothetical protein
METLTLKSLKSILTNGKHYSYRYACFYVLTLVTVMTFPRGASAISITEIGDAGQTLASAQDVRGTGADTILGSLLSASDVDLFQIHISSPGLFSAVGSSVPSRDGMLFLFDSSGRGVVNRDDSIHFGGNFGDLTSAFVVLEGDYFLGISLWDNLPPTDS